jgi:hypothetical protein
LNGKCLNIINLTTKQTKPFQLERLHRNCHHVRKSNSFCKKRWKWQLAVGDIHFKPQIQTSKSNVFSVLLQILIQLLKKECMILLYQKKRNDPTKSLISFLDSNSIYRFCFSLKLLSPDSIVNINRSGRLGFLTAQNIRTGEEG